ncbi:MAG: aminotransferase class V-fold PLP-dependent enzyme [Clostridia bacterium]|nr:aminotransferase class V-fold PLP-dependent enzyme [Clostridia bacterium]
MIYLDNAATTFPKPPQVLRAMTGVMERFGANPGRGGHRLALQAGRVVEACREAAAALLGTSPERIIFTRCCTESLNLAILGFVRPGDEVVCSHGEHNAVMRPLARLVAEQSVAVKVLQPGEDGVLSAETLRQALTPRTRLVVLCHASNVTGVVQPMADLGAVCREKGVPLLVDAAQSAGVLEVSLDALNADMVAAPGHKGLLGPHGTGLLALREGIAPAPLMVGGTGSMSESILQPDILPDRYESGTLNLPGIAGLLAGISHLRRHHREIVQREHALNERLRRQLGQLPGVMLLGDEHAPRVAVTSIVPRQGDAGALGDALDRSGVAVRAGLHCAPAIHAWLGTLQSGAVRFSPGMYTTEEEVDGVCALVERLTRHS